MGKKVQAEMDAQRQRFVDGCLENSGIEKGKANELFDLIDKFAGYGFNKSHAAAYALLAYQTAWLKTHYPHEFYAAAMCFDMHQSEKLAIFVDDMRRSAIELAGPDINRSGAEFSVEQTDDGYAVRYGLAGLRNVGEKAMDAIAAERDANGQFENLQQMFERLPQGSMNRRQLESLVSAGALDELEPNRAALFANADMLIAVAEAANRERTSGQGGLFGGEDHSAPELRLVQTEEWSRSEMMSHERDTFGFYFAAHPVTQFKAVASANGARPYSSIMESGVPGGGRQAAVMAAMVESVNRGKTRRGKDFVRADFSDPSGQFSAACFEETLVEPMQRWAKEGTCLLIQVELDSPSPDEPPRITIRSARPLSEVTGGTSMQLTLDIRDEIALHVLASLLESGTDGRGEVQARITTAENTSATILLGDTFQLDGELAEKLAGIDGLANVELKPKRAGSHLRLVA